MRAPAAGGALAAIDIHQRSGTPLRDAMNLRSAKELGCGLVHSEDLNQARSTKAFLSTTHSWTSGITI